MFSASTSVIFFLMEVVVGRGQGYTPDNYDVRNVIFMYALPSLTGQIKGIYRVWLK